MKAESKNTYTHTGLNMLTHWHINSLYFSLIQYLANPDAHAISWASLALMTNRNSVGC